MTPESFLVASNFLFHKKCGGAWFAFEIPWNELEFIALTQAEEGGKTKTSIYVNPTSLINSHLNASLCCFCLTCWFVRIISVNDKYLHFGSCLILLRVVMVAAAELAGAVVLHLLWSRKNWALFGRGGGSRRSTLVWSLLLRLLFLCKGGVGGRWLRRARDMSN